MVLTFLPLIHLISILGVASFRHTDFISDSQCVVAISHKRLYRANRNRILRIKARGRNKDSVAERTLLQGDYSFGS